MKVIKIEQLNAGLILYFSDGSAVKTLSSNGRDWLFYPGKPDKCLDSVNTWDYAGKCAFTFYYYPLSDGYYWKSYNFEPYASSCYGTVNSLKNHPNYGCSIVEKYISVWSSYCTKWIQYNGWCIPDDYSFKLSY